MTAASASARRTRVLFLYNVPDWAIHNVGRDWAALLEATHEFSFERFGEHELLDPDTFDHVIWGYSTLAHSGRMLLESLTRRPLAWWRWKSHSSERFAAVVQDPSELFPEVADWKHARPRLSHLRRFSRLAVTSNEMRDVMAGLGYETSKLPTHSLLPLREQASLVSEPLRVFTRAQAYPRKNLGLFMALQSRFKVSCERFDAVLGGSVMPQAEYVSAIDRYNCYVCTSWQEGGPLPLMDAMRRGCVVLTTRVGQTDDLIEQGVNGFFCNDETEFAARLQSLAADPEKLLVMRQAALTRAAERDDATSRRALQSFLP